MGKKGQVPALSVSCSLSSDRGFISIDASPVPSEQCRERELCCKISFILSPCLCVCIEEGEEHYARPFLGARRQARPHFCITAARANQGIRRVKLT